MGSNPTTTANLHQLSSHLNFYLASKHHLKHRFLRIQNHWFIRKTVSPITSRHQFHFPRQIDGNLVVVFIEPLADQE